MSDGNVLTFSLMLHQALAPITLISGVGLMMLCMSARFMHTTNRIRQLAKKRARLDLTDGKCLDLEQEIRLIYRRAFLLRLGMLTVALAALFSALLVAVSTLGVMLDEDFDLLSSILLILAVVLTIASSLIFSLEIKISLHALALEVAHLTPLPAPTDSTPKKD